MQIQNQPATIGAELFERLSHYVTKMTRFAEAGEFYLLRLEDDALKLAHASLYEADLVNAGLSHIKGQAEDVRARYAALLESYPAQAAQIGAVFAAYFSNLLLPRDARAAFVDTQPDVPLGINFDSWVITSGSYQYFKDLCDTMEGKSLAKLLPERPEMLLKAQQILANHDTSDDDCATIMDVAGTVMREHKLFWAGPTPVLMLDDELGNVLIQLQVAAGPEEISTMNDEVFLGLMAKDLDRKNLIVSFKGVAG